MGPPSSLTAAPGQAKTKGMQSGVDIGVKYSEKQQRNFDEAKMKAGQCVIGLQVSCPPAPEGTGGPSFVRPSASSWLGGPRLKVP